MAYTLTNSITYSQAFISGLNPTFWTGSEPALTSATQIAALITNAPFTWAWNRATTTQLLTPGTQDYTVSAANFGFLEKVTISLASPATLVELETVYNTKPLGLTKQSGRSNACAVQSSIPGTSATFRFSPNPDLAYTATFTYQKAPFQFTAVGNDWFAQAGIPISMIDVYNPLFLSEMFQYSDDPQRADQYRKRGMAALIGKADGLTSMQKNEIMGQWMGDTLQGIMANMNAQQGVQAKGV